MMRFEGVMASLYVALDLFIKAVTGEPSAIWDGDAWWWWLSGAAFWVLIAIRFARSNGKTEAV